TVIAIVFGILLGACGGPPDPDAVIRQAVAAHGGEHIDQVAIEFDFREYHYTIELDGGRFEYVRERPDSIGYIRDVINNDGFYREVDGERVPLPEDVAASYYSSLNSVAYFMLLPFKLTDEAAQSAYLAETEVNGEPYHEIEVTFRPDGGGRDYQDRFVYWIHRDRHTMDYLAYDYVTDDTGTRFREAFNVRTIGGIRFQDYYNYTSSVIDSPGDPIEDLDEELEAGTLELVSVIEKNNITVEPIDQ
ncbi:MAG: DUF6503 family protein, partial [Rhodothermales bacterium]